MKSGKILLGVLAGIAAGAVLGILFAPDKGAQTRKKIVDKGEGYADSLKEKYDDLVDSVTRKGQKAQQDAEDLVARGKAKYDDIKRDVKNSSV